MRPGLVEPLATFLGATAAASALYWTGQSVPFVQRNLHGLIAVVFLYAPAFAARLSKRPFDTLAAGLRLAPVGRGLKVAALGMAITWPLFFAAFAVFYGTACEARLPLARDLVERFAPMCPRWTGLAGATFRLPESVLLLSASQLVVVAVPEEWFFRGYLFTRLMERWPDSLRPLLASSALFALGHFLVDFEVSRLTVFFPALVFGWMRARTGSIFAGAVFHASCNVFSEVLFATFFSA